MMKKVVSLLLALVMALGLCVNVWAEGEKPQTGTVKKVEKLQKVGEATEDDLAAAKAFLGENGWFVYYEEGNQIMPRGTQFGAADFKTVTNAAVEEYRVLSEKVRAILETLYVTDGRQPCFFSYRVKILQEIADNPDPGPGPGGEQGEEQLDSELHSYGYQYPVLDKDFTVNYPRAIQGKSEFYEQNYDQSTGTLTIKIKKGTAEGWLTARNEASAGLNPGVYVEIVFTNANNKQFGTSTFGNGQVPDSFINGNAKLSAEQNANRGNNIPLMIGNEDSENGKLTLTSNSRSIRGLMVWDNAETMSEAAEKWMIRINIVHEEDFEYKYDINPVQRVQAERMTYTPNTAEDLGKWNVKTSAGVLTVSSNGQNIPVNTVLGTLVVTAPQGGYTLDVNQCVVKQGNLNVIKENNTGTDLKQCKLLVYTFDRGAGTAVYTLVWKNGADEIMESLTVNIANAQPWMMDVAKNVAAASEESVKQMLPPPLQSAVKYDTKLGFVTVDLSGLVPEMVLDLRSMGVVLPAPQGAVSYKVATDSSNTDPTTGNKEFFINAAKGKFDDPNGRTLISEGRVAQDCFVPYVVLSKITVDGIDVYFASDQNFRSKVVQWYNDAGEVIATNYVYVKNSPFVQSVTTTAKVAADETEQNPYIIGGDGERFTCERYPQENAGEKQYFKFTATGQHTGSYIVYIPYSYFGLTWEQAKTRTQKPVIKHYHEDHTWREDIQGEYTECGIKFEVSSFSPFVISTAAQSSSGGGYYYGGASTPGISAVKTADAAKSATDYTSGIYGLTFRSTAAFSGFKGVQVDGRTIAAANYIAEDNGGIEVYLKAVYLRTLKDGRHTVTILSDAGNVTMNFTIGGVDSPTTFDAGIGAYVGMALASVGGMTWMRRRKR